METLSRNEHIDALVLALVAGCVDSVAFLQLGGFYVSFMSGNSTRLGVGLGSGSWREAGLAAGLIATFVGGVALGSILGQRRGSGRRAALLIVESILLGVAGACHYAGHPAGATVPMVLAMGVANAVFERGGDVRFGVTYMTGALVRVGQRIAAIANGGSRDAWKPYASLWLALVFGASIGAYFYPLAGGQILWGPAALLLLLAVTSRRHLPEPSPWR